MATGEAVPHVCGVADGAGPAVSGEHQTYNENVRTACAQVLAGTADLDRADTGDGGWPACEQAGAAEPGSYRATVLEQQCQVQRSEYPSGVPERPRLANEAEHQQAWIEDVCVPATGDRDACARHVVSEAWPFGDPDPLATLASTYREPGYCDRWAFSDQGREFCDALAAHYTDPGR